MQQLQPEHIRQLIISLYNSANFIPYPASSLTLQYFLASLSDKLTYTTIKTYLAAICRHHINKSLSDPTSNKCLLHVMKGIKRLQVRSTSNRMAITLPVLKNLKMQLHRSEMSFHDKRMLWATLCLAFYGFLRSAEFVVSSITLCREDITMGSEITVIIKASKTDQNRRGTKVTISSTGTSTCPMSAMKKYLKHHLSQQHCLNFNFKMLNISKDQYSLPNFFYLLSRAGYDQKNYASHSFRIGAATTTAAEGLPDWLIQTLGRWSSDSYTRYIRTPNSEIVRGVKMMSKVVLGGGADATPMTF